jgi:hypothetical protein
MDLAFRMPLHDHNIKRTWPVPRCFSLVARGDEALHVLQDLASILANTSFSPLHSAPHESPVIPLFVAW